jgi:hypothetical protein
VFFPHAAGHTVIENSQAADRTHAALPNRN